MAGPSVSRHLPIKTQVEGLKELLRKMDARDLIQRPMETLVEAVTTQGAQVARMFAPIGETHDLVDSIHGEVGDAKGNDIEGVLAAGGMGPFYAGPGGAKDYPWVQEMGSSRKRGKRIVPERRYMRKAIRRMRTVMNRLLKEQDSIIEQIWRR